MKWAAKGKGVEVVGRMDEMMLGVKCPRAKLTVLNLLV